MLLVMYDIGPNLPEPYLSAEYASRRYELHVLLGITVLQHEREMHRRMHGNGNLEAFLRVGEKELPHSTNIFDFVDNLETRYDGISNGIIAPTGCLFFQWNKRDKARLLMQEQEFKLV